jgi:hypothetical protein
LIERFCNEESVDRQSDAHGYLPNISTSYLKLRPKRGDTGKEDAQKY